MAANQLSKKSPDGTLLGQSSADLIAFFGATPVARQSVSNRATGTLGDTNAVVTAIYNALVTYGLVTSAGG